MHLTLIQLIFLALVQGAAELLPISSSAHVIVAEKLMGLDPSSPEMTFLLVMLHTGTMFAVIVYFWRSWKKSYFSSAAAFQAILGRVVTATAVTGLIGWPLKKIIEKIFLKGGEVESLFSSLPLIAGALLAVGILIIYAGIRGQVRPDNGELSLRSSAWIGAVQGFCLPFRGFSRSGATISTGLLLGIGKVKMEEFSFALAVVLTPAVIGLELLRLLHAHAGTAGPAVNLQLLGPGLLGMVGSFFAGLLALRLLAGVLEKGQWKIFGYYCLVAAIFVAALDYTSQ
jgi:undecaprenyl-diphosphatase